MHLLLATARSDFQHMRQVARIGYILHFMYSAVNALVGALVDRSTWNNFLQLRLNITHLALYISSQRN